MKAQAIKSGKESGMPTGMKVKNPGKTLGRVLGYVFKRYAFAFVGVFLCIFISSYSSVQASAMIDDVITAVDAQLKVIAGGGTADYSGVMKVLLEMVVIFAVGTVALLIYNQSMVIISQKVLRDIRDDMFTKMQRFPVKYFDTHTFGETMSRYTSDTLEQLISQSIPQIVNSLTTIVVCLVMMFVKSWQLTVLVLLTVVLMFVVIKAIGGKSAAFFAAQQRSVGKLNGYIEEMINGQKVVKVFCYEERNKKGFDKVNDELKENATNANKYANIFMPIMMNLTYVQYVIVAVVGALLASSGLLIVGEGSTPLGLIAAFLLLSRTFTRPINMVSQQFNTVVMALAGAERIFELTDTEPEADNGYVTLVRVSEENGEIKELAPSDKAGYWAWKHPHGDGTLTYTRLAGEITLDKVDFSYDGVKQVLTDISIFAKPGQKIALIGKTGKTTISNLINRFYDIDDGKIRYDGININKIKKADLRRSLGVVLQDVHLFTDTVMENIRYGNKYATDEEVVAAAKLAHADDFIRRLPDGYNTVLTSDGANLSQGQRQLISIARVAVADPPVMILDEATSSIDTRTEKIVQTGMDNLMKGRTVFVIAHRLSTIRNSDCIMVMEGGKIIERGNHEELMKKKGVYYSLNS